MFKLVKRFFAKMKSTNPSIDITKDHHNAVHLKLTSLIAQKQLQAQVEIHSSEQLSSIWVYLSNQNLNHVGMLYKMGFKIHHGLQNNIVVYKWMLPNLKDLVTPYSMFYISCGALIINNNHVLVVQQKNGIRKGQYGIPGGRADLGQSLPNCAQRQLFEETGIKGKFKNIIYYRQLNKTLFDGCDIYFVCLMQCQPQDLKEIKLCPRQLSGFQWVHLSKYEEFMKQHALGTQQIFGTYLGNLYNEGFNFDTDIHNMTKQTYYKSKMDGIERIIVQHMVTMNKKKTQL